MAIDPRELPVSTKRFDFAQLMLVVGRGSERYLEVFDVPFSIKNGKLDIGAVAGDSAAAALIDVADNAAKLALTGIAAQQQVRVTGEGNRIEQFIGGNPALDASWVILRNTIQLSVNNQNAPSGTATAVFTLNGVSCPTGQVTSVGWVDPTHIPFTAAGDNQLWQIIGNAYGGTPGVEIITGDGGDNPSAFASLCLATAPRGIASYSIFCGAV